jgi:hypothetical protein
MSPDTLDRFVAVSSRLEGVIPWLYLDIRGLVTTGIGCLVDPVGLALDVPFQIGDRPATQEEIADVWHRVKASTPLAHLGAKAASKLTALHLPPAGVRQLLERRLRANEAYLVKHHFPALLEWPENVQLAIALIAWACGAGFPASWPSFTAAALAEDWALAAKHATISTHNNAGIAPRNQAIQELLTC